MSKPDVSVLMAVYNGLTNYPAGWRVTDAIMAAVYQSGVSVEVCAVDDASTDGTWAELEALGWQLDRVRVMRRTMRRGPAHAYQDAAEMAGGRYCIQQSVRSWYEPGAFAAMVKALDDNPEVGFVYGWTQFHGQRTDLYQPPPFQAEGFLSSFVSLFGVMYRREALDAGCRYEHYLERDGVRLDMSDWDFTMQMICNLGWRGLVLDEVCLHYYYSGKGQMTERVHRYQDEMNAVFYERWGRYAGRLADVPSGHTRRG